MTYKDLDIDLTGPSIDGRAIKVSDGPGKALAFGEGLPKSVPNQLKWNNSKIDDSAVKPTINAEDSLDLTKSEADIYFPHIKGLTEEIPQVKNDMISVRSINSSYGSEDGIIPTLEEYERRPRVPSRNRYFFLK